MGGKIKSFMLGFLTGCISEVVALYGLGKKDMLKSINYIAH